MPRQLVLLVLLVLFAVAALSGCTATTVDYDKALVELPIEGAGPVGIAVRDTRGVALVNPSWVGVARKTMGIPSEVHTRSGGPFAADLAAAIGACLEQSGLEPHVVEVPSGMERDDVLRALRTESAFQRWLLVDVADWRSDGYFGELSLVYRLYLEVGASGATSQPFELEGEKVADYGERGGYAGACRRLFSEIVGELFAEVRLVEPGGAPPTVSSDGPDEPPVVERATCGDCQAALADDWQVCPYCGRPR